MQGKAGMEYLVRVAARLYAKKGINCNAVIPGLVLAGMASVRSNCFTTPYGFAEAANDLDRKLRRKQASKVEVLSSICSSRIRHSLHVLHATDAVNVFQAGRLTP